MLIVVVPVFIMLIWFSIKYRASNKKANYLPNWNGSSKIELAIWLIPVAIVIALSFFLWTNTHQLDPYKPIVSKVKPIHVEVVSMDWCWLFIYPDFKIATVNELVFPANTPLNFRLTSATVMTSFFIPQLGSQMYAMAGMKTQLHLMANETGIFKGHNQEFSGLGYENMYFNAFSTTQEQFNAWLQKVKQSADTLNTFKFEQISKPNPNHQIEYFSNIDVGLFDYILKKSKGVKDNDMLNKTGSNDKAKNLNNKSMNSDKITDKIKEED